MKINHVIIFFIIVCVSLHYISTSTHEIKLNNFVEAMVSKTSAKDLCSLRDAPKNIKQLCRNKFTLFHVIDKARNLANLKCKETFKYELWNCDIGIVTTGKLYRETAFLHALYAAAIAYSISQACSKGQLDSCICKPDYSYGNSLEKWKQAGCADNLDNGVKYTRQFLKSFYSRRDPVTRILQHNSEIGLNILDQHLQQQCKCHGVSGSFSIKTCWQHLSPFENVVESLKIQYHKAKLLEFSNRVAADDKKLLSNLLYLETSPSFCNNTHGRECLNPNNCETLCCTRGYSIKNIKTKIYCNCYWEPIIILKCKTCHTIKQKFTCF